MSHNKTFYNTQLVKVEHYVMKAIRKKAVLSVTKKMLKLSEDKLNKVLVTFQLVLIYSYEK